MKSDTLNRDSDQPLTQTGELLLANNMRRPRSEYSYLRPGIVDLFTSSNMTKFNKKDGLGIYSYQTKIVLVIIG